jgi:hypothetical protein
MRQNDGVDAHSNSRCTQLPRTRPKRKLSPALDTRRRGPTRRSDVGFFLYERFVRGETVGRIFQHLYFEPQWQTLFNVSHSIPLFLLLSAFFWWCKSRSGLLLGMSLLLHSLVDWPTHLEDAHAYFWPLWREPLPGVVSYWHSGSMVAIESGIIVVAVVWLAWETASSRRRGRTVPV